MTSATDRFRMLLAGALERVCVLEAELEQANEEISDLKTRLEEGHHDQRRDDAADRTA